VRCAPGQTHPEQAAADSRANLLKQPFAFELPALEAPPPPTAAKPPALPPLPPPPPPMQDPLVAWCKRRSISLESVTEVVSRKRARRAALEHAWNPRCWQKRLELARLKEEDATRNNLCTCDEGVPSWLCRVARCYSFEIGTCPEACMPGEHECECMELAPPLRYGDDGGPWEPPPLMRMRSTDPRACIAFEWSSPMFQPDYWDPAPAPIGGWGTLVPAIKPPAPPRLECACVWTHVPEAQPLGRHGTCLRCGTAIRPAGHPDLWQPDPGPHLKVDIGRALAKSSQVGADIKVVLDLPNLPKFCKHARIQLLVRRVLGS
jgi:hypothetical protein